MSYSTPVPTTAVPTLREKTLDGLREKKAMLTEGEWIGVAALVAVTLVASLVVAIFTYYLITDAFSTVGTTVGKYAALGWVSSGSGLLLLLFMVLFTTLCGGAMGLAFKGKSSSLAASVGVALLLSVVVYWAFDAAIADRAFQVMLWALIAVVGGVILAAYGWKMSKDLVASEPKSEAVESRSKYSLYMLVAAIVVGVILLLAFWNIYSAVPVTP